MSKVEKDNAFIEFHAKFTNSPAVLGNKPLARNPILQDDIDLPKTKVYSFKAINSSPEKKSGIKVGSFAVQSKKSNIFGEPSNDDFVPSRKYIPETLTDIPAPKSLKKSICQPPQRDPIVQDTITPNNPKPRDKNFTSTVFNHLYEDPYTQVEAKERKGK
jgi:hypothetical protein